MLAKSGPASRQNNHQNFKWLELNRLESLISLSRFGRNHVWSIWCHELSWATILQSVITLLEPDCFCANLIWVTAFLFDTRVEAYSRNWKCKLIKKRWMHLILSYYSVSSWQSINSKWLQSHFVTRLHLKNFLTSDFTLILESCNVAPLTT